MLFILIGVLCILIGVGLIVLAISESISEKIFIRTALKAKGKVVAFLEKELEEYVEFEELDKYKFVKPIIEFQDQDGDYFRVKSRRFHPIDEARSMGEMDIWYEEKDPTNAKVDGVYLMTPQNQKIMQIIGAFVVVAGMIILYFYETLTITFASFLN